MVAIFARTVLVSTVLRAVRRCVLVFDRVAAIKLASFLGAAVSRLPGVGVFRSWLFCSHRSAAALGFCVALLGLLLLDRVKTCGGVVWW